MSGDTVKEPLRDLEWLTGHHLDRAGLPGKTVGPVNTPELVAIRNHDRYRQIISQEPMWFCYLSAQGAKNKDVLDRLLENNKTLQPNGEELPFAEIIKHHDGFRTAMFIDRAALLKEQNEDYWKNPFAYRVVQPVLDLLEFNGYLETKIRDQKRKLESDATHKYDEQHKESIVLYRALQKIVENTIREDMNAEEVLEMQGIDGLFYEIKGESIPKIRHHRREEHQELEAYHTALYRALGANLTTRETQDYKIPMVKTKQDSKVWQESVVRNLYHRIETLEEDLNKLREENAKIGPDTEQKIRDRLRGIVSRYRS